MQVFIFWNKFINNIWDSEMPVYAVFTLTLKMWKSKGYMHCLLGIDLPPRSINFFMCIWYQGKRLSSLVAPPKLQKCSKRIFTCILWSSQNIFRIVKVLNYLLLSLIHCCFPSDTLWNTLVCGGRFAAQWKTPISSF